MSSKRVSLGEEGKGHSMLMDRTEKAVDQQWRVWCEESGMLRVSEVERRVREGV